MAPISRIGTSTAVTALIASILLLFLLLAGYLIYRDYRDTIIQAETKAANAAHVASAHVRWLIEAKLQTLQRLDDALRNDGMLKIAVSRDPRALLDSLPQDVILFVADAQGQPILATDDSYLRINIADRDYFETVRNGASQHIGKLTSDRATGKMVFAISRRMVRDGQFAGAAVAIVPAEVMSEFWASLDLGPNSSVGLIRDDGWLVARHPVPGAAIDLSRYRLFTEYLPKSPFGTYQSGQSPADGVPRIIGYHKVPGLPLVTIGGVARETTLAPYRRRLGVLGLIGGPLLIALLGVSSWAAMLLTREERAQKQLAMALDRNRLLMKDIHHRVKNNMQIVSALVHLQPGPPEIKREMTRRLSAMAALHQQIYQAEDVESIDLAAYLRGLVEELKDSYGSRAAIVYDLESFSADRDLALPLALIASEAVSNAFKYAFPDGRDGTIAITLRLGDKGGAMLRIRDDGVGFDPASARQSLGMRLIEAFAKQIGGAYAVTGDSGTTFTLTFPRVSSS